MLDLVVKGLAIDLQQLGGFALVEVHLLERFQYPFILGIDAYTFQSGFAPGGLTDRYLSDYPNMYGDLSAGSGLNALTRDEDFTRDFLTRHRDKLLFGSDCNDRDGGGPDCLGARIVAAVRRLAATRQI